MEVFKDLLKLHVRFLGPSPEAGQVLGVFRQAVPDGLIEKIGNAPIGLGRLETQGSMQSRVQIDGYTPGCAQRPTLAPWNQNVNSILVGSSESH